MQDAFAVVAFDEWFKAKRHCFEGFELRCNKSMSTHRVTDAEIDTPTHSVSICAWDQGNSLEIQITDLATEKTTIEDESCADKDQLLARLNKFLDWFTAQHG